MIELSIVIPTKDRGGILDATLAAAVKAVDGLRAEIIVVNDSKTREPVLLSDPRVRQINNPKQGVASARNCGARVATGEVILFLDDDIVISPESVRHVLSVHRQLDGIALNLDWIYPPEILRGLDGESFGRFLINHNMTTFKGWYANPGWKENQLFESLSVASFHLSLRRTDFERSEGYDEEFPHAGFEDFDFPIRLKKAGMRFFIDTRQMVYHNESDRTTMKPWLENQERRAMTRAIAVRRGYSELTIDYTPGKRRLLSLILACQPLIQAFMKMIPSSKGLDSLEFRLIGALQAAKIYRGYMTGMKQ